MNVHREFSDIEGSVDLVDKAGLLGTSNGSVELPLNYVSQVKGLPYREYWEKYNKSFWYHIKLEDESLILFEESSFRYIMCPINIPTEEDFIYSDLGEHWDIFSIEEKEQYISSDDFRVSYEKYVETTAHYKSHTPVRLDKHPNQHKPIDHPAHHLHIGYENDSRIPVKRILSPLAFTAFIISTFYPKAWVKLYKEDILSPEMLATIKVNLGMVSHLDQRFWDDDLEEKRLYLV
ncbi:DUF2290 domain-containing protein [Sodalis sp. RH15]|uniref:DUF2290 domain-containing protein n=1 Tax=Sodalis sp. RH15 TaxID=3394330 RepID=UPI0039B45D5D